jgi:hypothetical protein
MSRSCPARFAIVDLGVSQESFHAPRGDRQSVAQSLLEAMTRARFQDAQRRSKAQTITWGLKNALSAYRPERTAAATMLDGWIDIARSYLAAAAA